MLHYTFIASSYCTLLSSSGRSPFSLFPPICLLLYLPLSILFLPPPSFIPFCLSPPFAMLYPYIFFFPSLPFIRFLSTISATFVCNMITDLSTPCLQYDRFFKHMLSYMYIAMCEVWLQLDRLHNWSKFGHYLTIIISIFPIRKNRHVIGPKSNLLCGRTCKDISQRQRKT